MSTGLEKSRVSIASGEETEQDRANIKSLSEQFPSVSIEIIRLEYQTIRDSLLKDAKVFDYIPVLAFGRAKERLAPVVPQREK